MALLRLFRIPRGKSPADGAYVAYPFDELIGFARVESERRRCLIVGEDLGNVPDGFRDRMERERIFSYRLLLFEREHDGRFRPPGRVSRILSRDRYDARRTHACSAGSSGAISRCAKASVCISPEAANEGRVRCADVDASQLARSTRVRGRTRRRETFHALHAAGSTQAFPRRVARFDALTRAAYRFLAKTPARLVLVQLDDAAGELEQINLPGTFTEYPNWRRKSGLDLDGIARDERIAALVADVRTLWLREEARHESRRHGWWRRISFTAA